jgi:hypothetical protein
LYEYGAGFLTEKTAEFLLADRIATINLSRAFEINGGYGIFGESGINISNYRINALYKSSRIEQPAGTLFSIKEQNRW